MTLLLVELGRCEPAIKAAGVTDGVELVEPTEEADVVVVAVVAS